MPEVWGVGNQTTSRGEQHQHEQRDPLESADVADDCPGTRKSTPRPMDDEPILHMQLLCLGGHHTRKTAPLTPRRGGGGGGKGGVSRVVAQATGGKVVGRQFLAGTDQSEGRGGWAEADWQGCPSPQRGGGGLTRVALEGEGPQRRPQKRLDRRFEEVARAVGGGYCRLPMRLNMAFAVTETVAAHGLGFLEGGGGDLPPSNASLGLICPHFKPFRRSLAEVEARSPLTPNPPAPCRAPMSAPQWPASDASDPRVAHAVPPPSFQTTINGPHVPPFPQHTAPRTDLDQQSRPQKDMLLDTGCTTSVPYQPTICGTPLTPGPRSKRLRRRPVLFSNPGKKPPNCPRVHCRA